MDSTLTDCKWMHTFCHMTVSFLMQTNATILLSLQKNGQVLLATSVPDKRSNLLLSSFTKLNVTSEITTTLFGLGNIFLCYM